MRRVFEKDARLCVYVLNLTCFEHASCTSGKKIMHCLYDGGHGDYPEGGHELALWLLLRHRLPSMGGHEVALQAATKPTTSTTLLV